jgi:hypothetical protein
MKEIWKDVSGYEGIYKVSNLGNVKSVDHTVTIISPHYYNGRTMFIKGKDIALRNTKRGYKAVVLCYEGSRKDYSVHRLVAEHFLENPNNLPVINHIDENKQNNIVTNLEWCDQPYNVTYGTRAQKYSIPIVQYDLEGNIIKEWQSANVAAKELNIPQSSINDCCRGKANKTHNYKWSYKI